MADDGDHLTTGWELDLAVGDSLLRRFVFNWGAMVEAHADPAAKLLRRSDLWAVDLGRPAGMLNCATLLQPLSQTDAPEVLAALDAFYFANATASGMVLLVSAWPTPDLRAAGWNLMGHPPVHLRPPGGTAPRPPADLRIAPVTSLAELRAFEQVVVDGFPFDDVQPLSPGALFNESILNDHRSRLWLGWNDGQAVSAASAFIEHGVVQVDLVATLPAARRRGHGAALTWTAALCEPALPAMLLSSDEGRPIYERMGFLPLSRFTFWWRPRPAP